jgi:hypothetical protein
MRAIACCEAIESISPEQLKAKYSYITMAKWDA